MLRGLIDGIVLLACWIGMMVCLIAWAMEDVEHSWFERTVMLLLILNLLTTQTNNPK